MTRIKQVKMTDELLGDLLTEDRRTMVDCVVGLPEGARLFGFVWEYNEPLQDMVIGLVYEHESFEDIADYEPIPVIPVEFETIRAIDLW